MNLIYATQYNSYKNVVFKFKILICIIQYSRGKQNSRHLFTWVTVFCTVMSNIFSKIAALFPLTNTHEYQFTSTKQKVSDNSDIYWSLQNCGSSVWNYSMSPFWNLETGGGFKIFGKFMHPCIMVNK
jgi:hypothetical protein